MKQGQNTRRRLLDAARGIFAERGYYNATVRDIALRARTNAASINYHFRSKDDLYREVMRSTFQPEVSSTDRPCGEIALTGDTPPERLRAFAHLLIQPNCDDAEAEKNRRLMAWEILAPTGAIETVEDWEIGRHLVSALSVVRPFLNHDASESDARATALWLIGQCLVFRKLTQRVGSDTVGTAGQSVGDFHLDDQHLIDLIVARAMSGLCA